MGGKELIIICPLGTHLRFLLLIISNIIILIRLPTHRRCNHKITATQPEGQGLQTRVAVTKKFARVRNNFTASVMIAQNLVDGNV